MQISQQQTKRAATEIALIIFEAIKFMDDNEFDELVGLMKNVREKVAPVKDKYELLHGDVKERFNFTPMKWESKEDCVSKLMHLNRRFYLTEYLSNFIYKKFWSANAGTRVQFWEKEDETTLINPIRMHLLSKIDINKLYKYKIEMENKQRELGD